jgi:hypothetical protein
MKSVKVPSKKVSRFVYHLLLRFCYFAFRYSFLIFRSSKRPVSEAVSSGGDVPGLEAADLRQAKDDEADNGSSATGDSASFVRTGLYLPSPPFLLWWH